jgi:hypothetical protein
MVTVEELVAAQSDPKSEGGNLYVRAGFLLGLAALPVTRPLDDEDRLLLARASGSLIEYSKLKEAK